MTSMTVSEARAALPHVLDLVEQGEDVTITRHGRVVAVVSRPPDVTARTAAALTSAARIRDVVTSAVAEPISGGLTAERAERLVAELRRERAER